MSGLTGRTGQCRTAVSPSPGPVGNRDAEAPARLPVEPSAAPSNPDRAPSGVVVVAEAESTAPDTVHPFSDPHLILRKLIVAGARRVARKCAPNCAVLSTKCPRAPVTRMVHGGRCTRSPQPPFPSAFVGIASSGRGVFRSRVVRPWFRAKDYTPKQVAGPPEAARVRDPLTVEHNRIGRLAQFRERGKSCGYFAERQQPRNIREGHFARHHRFFDHGQIARLQNDHGRERRFGLGRGPVVEVRDVHGAVFCRTGFQPVRIRQDRLEACPTKMLQNLWRIIGFNENPSEWSNSRPAFNRPRHNCAGRLKGGDAPRCTLLLPTVGRAVASPPTGQTNTL